MASVVQTTAFGTNVTTSPAVQHFTTAPTSGNMILIACCLSNSFDPGNITGITDNQTGSPNTYSKVISQIDGEGGDNCSVELWQCTSVTYVSGTFTVSAAFSAGQSVQICLMEAAGYTTTADATGGHGTTANPLTATATSANTNMADLEVCICAVSFGASAISNPAWTSSAQTIAWANTWALGTGNSGGSPNQASYQIANAIATTQAYWNWTVAESGAGLVASFAPQAVAPSVIIMGQACL
jgi:hypothetical protein